MEASMKLAEWISQFNDEALMANGFKDAIIGIAERCGMAAKVE